MTIFTKVSVYLLYTQVTFGAPPNFLLCSILCSSSLLRESVYLCLHVSPDVKLSPVDEKAKKKAAVSLMDRISEGSESDKSAPSRKGKAGGVTTPQKNKSQGDVSEHSSSSMQEVIDEASQLDSHMSSEKTSSVAMKIKTSGPAALNRGTRETAASDAAGLRSLKDEELSYSMDFSDAGSTLAQSHSKAGFAVRGGSEAGEISEHIEPSSVASAARSPASVSSQLRFDFKAGSKSAGDGAAISAADSLPPSTGIQESDSETESRLVGMQSLCAWSW